MAARVRNRGDHVQGTIYTLHFTVPYGHAKHYRGWAIAGGLIRRLTEHRAGNGKSSPLIRALLAAGGDWVVADLTPGTRFDERRMKKRGGASRDCPICRGEVELNGRTR